MGSLVCFRRSLTHIFLFKINLLVQFNAIAVLPLFVFWFQQRLLFLRLYLLKIISLNNYPDERGSFVAQPIKLKNSKIGHIDWTNGSEKNNTARWNTGEKKNFSPRRRYGCVSFLFDLQMDFFLCKYGNGEKEGKLWIKSFIFFAELFAGAAAVCVFFTNEFFPLSTATIFFCFCKHYVRNKNRLNEINYKFKVFMLFFSLLYSTLKEILSSP